MSEIAVFASRRMPYEDTTVDIYGGQRPNVNSLFLTTHSRFLAR
jgi:hypothetical protein